MGLKRFLPMENYTLTTSLPAEEIRKKLFTVTRWGNTSRVYPAQFYSGTIVGDSFKISREIAYRNSFLPVIEGKITESQGKTQIAIRMRLDRFVLIFMCIFAGLLAIPCALISLAGFLYVSRHGFHAFEPLLLVPFGMLLFGWALSFFAFKAESGKSKRFLEELLVQ